MKYYIDAWKKTFTFTGRARRTEYWLFQLINMVVIYGLIGIGIAIEVAALPMVASVIALISIIPILAVGVRRMHDVGKSGWFLLIPIYNFILTLTPGTVGTNKYGPDPKNPELGEDIMEHLVEN